MAKTKLLNIFGNYFVALFIASLIFVFVFTLADNEKSTGINPAFAILLLFALVPLGLITFYALTTYFRFWITALQLLLNCVLLVEPFVYLDRTELEGYSLFFCGALLLAFSKSVLDLLFTTLRVPRQSSSKFARLISAFISNESNSSSRTNASTPHGNGNS